MYLARFSGALEKNEDVRIAGYYTFTTRSRAARADRSPRTVKAELIPASAAPAFKAGKALKDAVNGRCGPAAGAHGGGWVDTRCRDPVRLSRFAIRRNGFEVRIGMQGQWRQMVLAAAQKRGQTVNSGLRLQRSEPLRVYWRVCDLRREPRGLRTSTSAEFRARTVLGRPGRCGAASGDSSASTRCTDSRARHENNDNSTNEADLRGQRDGDDETEEWERWSDTRTYQAWGRCRKLTPGGSNDDRHQHRRN